MIEAKQEGRAAVVTKEALDEKEIKVEHTVASLMSLTAGNLWLGARAFWVH